MTKTIWILAIAAAFVAGSIATGTMAFADNDDELLESSVVGLPDSMIASTGVMLRSVGGGGCPWVIDEGEVELNSNGELKVKVEGLLITSSATNTACAGIAGTTGPVANIWASLTCEGGGVFTSPVGAPLSASGDAELETTIAIPPTCVGPIILVRANTGMGPWIAASGF